MARLLFLSRSTTSTSVPHPSALASPAAAPTHSTMLLDSAPPRSRVPPPVPDSAPPTSAVRETGMAPRALLLPAVYTATAPSPPSDDAPQAQLASAHVATSSAVTAFPHTPLAFTALLQRQQSLQLSSPSSSPCICASPSPCPCRTTSPYSSTRPSPRPWSISNNSPCSCTVTRTTPCPCPGSNAPPCISRASSACHCPCPCRPHPPTAHSSNCRTCCWGPASRKCALPRRHDQH